MTKTKADATDWQAAIKDLFRKMDRNERERERLRADSEKVKIETRDILARIASR